MFRNIPSTEKSSVTFTHIDDDSIRCEFATKLEEGAATKFALSLVFDFSDCTRDELIKLATNTSKL